MSNDPSAHDISPTNGPVPGSPDLVSAFEKLAKNLLEKTDMPKAEEAGHTIFSSLDQIKQNQVCAVAVTESVYKCFNGSAQLPQDTARLLLVAVGETLVAAIDSNDQDFRKSALALSQRIRVSPLV